jgi:hypothetical protein
MSVSTYKADKQALAKVIQGWDRSSLGVLTGNAEIYRLAHMWIAILISSGYRVHVIDCAIRFNVYRMIECTNLLGVDAQEFLMTGIVQRAFTPYQILDVCHGILNGGNSPNDIYFILAPSKQFFDGDVKDAEGYFLLQKLISVFAKMQARGIPLVAVESKKYKHKTFQFLFPDLIRLANANWEYNTLAFGRETFQRFEVSYKNTVVGHTQYRLEILGGENGKNSNALFESGGSDRGQATRF